MSSSRSAAAAVRPSPSSPTTSQTTFQFTGVTPNITLNYTTLPGNNPDQNNNIVAWWEGVTSLAIPYGQAPSGTFSVTSTIATGSIAIPALISTNSYVVGYSVGPQLSTSAGAQAWGNICTLGIIPPAGGGSFTYSTPEVPSVSATIQSDSLSVSYSLPTSNTPVPNGAWIGVYDSTPDIYDAPPQYFQPITENLDSGGGVSFNNVPLDRGVTYTIVMFMSGYSTSPSNLTLGTAAASFVFTIPS